MSTVNTGDPVTITIAAPPAVGKSGDGDSKSETQFRPVLIDDPTVQEEIEAIIARRQAWGGDRYDEVWEGVYVMAPMANDEHQFFVLRLSTILDLVLGLTEEAEVRPGVNVSDREENWRENYRVPDVAVFPNGTKAQNRDTFWLGGPEFSVEITSPYDRAHEKLPFYAKVGVEEVLIVNRQRWQLELYQRDGDELKQTSVATVENKGVLTPSLVPLSFRLLAGEEDDRPTIEVQHIVDGEIKQTWRI